jgi:hypothetical protein
VSATYGDNVTAVRKNNAAAHMTSVCNGRSTCSYTIDQNALGDPAYGIEKNVCRALSLRQSRSDQSCHCGSAGRLEECSARMPRLYAASGVESVSAR